LEDVGFDVGRSFPMLRTGQNRTGDPVVELGRVSAGVASQLSTVLTEAAQQGIAVPTDSA
jgi:hypothetical protein